VEGDFGFQNEAQAAATLVVPSPGTGESRFDPALDAELRQPVGRDHSADGGEARVSNRERFRDPDDQGPLACSADR
jgi:hypothetical protein